MRHLLVACLVSFPALAGPAAVQVCIKLPTGEQLFSAQAAPNFREVAGGQFMLDLDVFFDGRKVERVTPGKGSCVRAWTEARSVSKVSLGFERIALNLESAPREVALKLKPDLFFEGPQLQIEIEPFATVTKRAKGELTFTRETVTGPRVEDPSALPAGKYSVSYVAPPTPQGDCEAKVELFAMGSLTREKDPKAVDALAENYAAQLLPKALSDAKITCAPDEEVVAEVLLSDGIYVRPLQPKLTKRVVPSKKARTVLRHDGVAQVLDQAISLEVKPGEHFEVIDVGSASPETPPIARR
ncbi:MAG: hypothetical protein U0228_28370 [Myxococcaceae bacterium]